MQNFVTLKMLAKRSWFACLLVFIQINAFGQTSHPVDVKNYLYVPAQITINAGDTVIWTNSEGHHNVNGLQSIFTSNPESFGNSVSGDWVFSHVFTLPGTYDYQCDPHTSFGMYGKVIVEAVTSGTLTLNFTGMNPHVGQTLWYTLTEEESGNQIARASRVVEASFTLEIPGIENGKSYWVEFFADHNGNGYYDAPPVDHAYRYELENVSGNEVLDFAHNTDFTDIRWKHRLRVRFSGMTPHVGQMLTLFVREKSTGAYLDTISLDAIPGAEFDVESYVIVPGGSYLIDLYADHNGNGVYDAPSADHAYRIETGEIMGDRDIDFVHNTNFTNIFETTAAAGRSADLEITMYPNPAIDQLTIVSGSDIESVILYNTTGAILMRHTRIGTKHLAVSLEGIFSGIYMVEVRTADQKQVVGRLVKR
jgi:plastocyanin/uncharacterized protein (DUF2141 family)